MDIQTRKPSIRNFVIYQFGVPLLQPFKKLVPRYLLVGNTPFLDSSEFAWTQTLEKHWYIIRQELDDKVCPIRVHDQIWHWQEGKTMVFDDTYPHKAWNETDQIRGVLFLDSVCPLRLPLSCLSQIFIQLIAWFPYIRDAQANQKVWDQQFAQAVAQVKKTADSVAKV